MKMNPNLETTKKITAWPVTCFIIVKLILYDFNLLFMRAIQIQLLNLMVMF